MIRRLLHSREAILLLVLVALFAVLAVKVEGFFDAYNLLERTRYWVAPGLLAAAMTFVIATGGIDLSVASVLALCGIVMGMLRRDLGWPMPAAAGAALATGLAAGAANGAVISRIGVPPLVVTLATMSLFRGAAMGLSQAKAIGDFPAGFLWLGQGSLCKVPGTGANPADLPVPLVILLAVYALAWALMHRSWVGRFTELVGENETAARFAAIDVRRLKFALYASVGLLCGFAALLHTAIYATAKADTAAGMELEAIACVVVGGTRISGGHASIVGTLLGLAILGILRFGLEMAGVSSQNIIILVGIVLVATAIINERLGRSAVR
jgi:rhamnose transport system permease protein